MHFSGEYRVPAPRERVWSALNDPETLRASIPRCEALQADPDGLMRALIVARVGPLKLRFHGEVRILDRVPPLGYTIRGHGSGGLAGSGRGEARVQMIDEGETTLIRYEAEAELGGAAARLGASLVETSAEKFLRRFFERLALQITGGEASAVAAAR